MDEGKTIYGKVSLSDEIARFPPDPESESLRRAEILIKTDTIRVVLINMLEGAVLEEHSAPGPITVHVLGGKIEFSVKHESNTMGVGDLISVAPGVRHHVRCLEAGSFLLTIGVMTRIPDPGGRART